jgi:hypothetical protein
MENQIINLSFDEWIRYVFDHPVTEPEWYWEEHDFWDPMVYPRVTVSYLTRLFENPVASLSAYSDSQLSQGLYYIVSNNVSDHMFALRDGRVPLPERLKGLEAMFIVFDELFASRCSANLCYLSEEDKGVANPLDGICYMWWDILPIHGVTAGRDTLATADTILDVITRILALDSDRESALHGLGHWYYYDPTKITGIVDKFLASHRQIRPELFTYARRARKGHVQ